MVALEKRLEFSRTRGRSASRTFTAFRRSSTKSAKSRVNTGTTIIEDAAESLGATYKGRQTGTFGAYNAISFNGNKIITGSSGGMLLTDDQEAANKARKWSTESLENAPLGALEEIDCLSW